MPDSRIASAFHRREGCSGKVKFVEVSNYLLWIIFGKLKLEQAAAVSAPRRSIQIGAPGPLRPRRRGSFFASARSLGVGDRFGTAFT